MAVTAALRAVASAAAFAALAPPAAAAAAAKELLHLAVEPGAFINAAATIDASGAPAFAFGSGSGGVPAGAAVYDGVGRERWSFTNRSAGPDDSKYFEVESARHCESAGKGAGAVDVFVTEGDDDNEGAFTIFGFSSEATSSDPPTWTLPFSGCFWTDGGFVVKSSDSGGRIAVQCKDASKVRGSVFGVNGQTGAIEWRYNTTNALSGTDMEVKISANGAWVLYADAFAPGTTNNATVLAGATGAVRYSSIPLPYYNPASAISDSGNYVAVADEIAANVYKWSAKKAAYELAYVLVPPAGATVSMLSDLSMSTGRDKDELIVALYNGDKGAQVCAWSLVDAQLLTNWVSSVATSDGVLSVDGDFIGVPLTTVSGGGAVLLARGSNEAVFSFESRSELITASVIVVPAAGGGGGETVYFAAAGGKRDSSGANPVGDAYAFQVDVAATPAAAAAAAAAPPCFGTFGGQLRVEEVCFTTLLNSSVVEGLSVREYAAAAAAAAEVVSFNASAMYSVAGFDDALTLAGFGVIEYFSGGFNKKKENLLDARTVPFLLLPPAAAGGWVGRMALAPSKFGAGVAKPPAPLDNVTIAPLGAEGAPLTLAVQRLSTADAPTGAQLAALCAKAANAIAAGILPGYAADPASPFAAGVYAFYWGRDTFGVTFESECWLGVAASSAQ
jgi:hypothetical protein